MDKLHYYPSTVEDALRDLATWSAYCTRFPERKKDGGIHISEALMRDLCTRVLKLEEAAND